MGVMYQRGKEEYSSGRKRDYDDPYDYDDDEDEEDEEEEDDEDDYED